MYQVGDLIVFGNKGVCKIDNIGTLESFDSKKLYYTLIPYFSSGGKIYTPVDNDKVIMRPLISKEEALKLIEDIKNIDTIWITNEKRREHEYKEAIRKCDCRELVRIIKTIYLRKQSRLTRGKRVLSIDSKYYKIAEENFYGELSISLGMNIDEVKKCVLAKIKQSETSSELKNKLNR
ncbi:MAG: Transcriptional regulator, CarD family [Lachnoclostridium sp.]|jgi:CarD family transcriptional regulator